MRKTTLARPLARRVDVIHLAPFELGEIGPDSFEAVCRMGMEGLVSSTAIVRIAPAVLMAG
jgi:bifunctional non-homologous end joining protein LigD